MPLQPNSCLYDDHNVLKELILSCVKPLPLSNMEKPVIYPTLSSRRLASTFKVITTSLAPASNELLTASNIG